MSTRDQAAPAAQTCQTLRTVRPGQPIDTRQGLPNFLGVSAQTTGATGIAMHKVVIPPGAAAKPHLHRGFETAIYIVSGRVLTRYGDGLTQSVVNEAGDFLFIPASLPHQPVNLSDTEPAVAIVARNDADEQEGVELYPEASDRA